MYKKIYEELESVGDLIEERKKLIEQHIEESDYLNKINDLLETINLINSVSEYNNRYELSKNYDNILNREVITKELNRKEVLINVKNWMDEFHKEYHEKQDYDMLY